MSAATSTPAPSARGPASAPSLLAEHLPLGIELLADMILRPHFDAGRPRAREGGGAAGAGRGARHARRDIIFDDLWAAAYPDQPLGRSILGDEDEHRRDRRSTISTAGGPSRYRAGSLYLVAAGKVDHDALVALAEARFADLPEGVIDPPEPARFAGGARVGPARAPTRPISPSPIAGAGAARPRLLCGAPVRRPGRRRRLVAAVPGGARGARARLYGLGVAPVPIATPASSTSMPRPRAARPPPPRR